MCLCPLFSCAGVVKQTLNPTQHEQQHAVLCLVLAGSLVRKIRRKRILFQTLTDMCKINM